MESKDQITAANNNRAVYTLAELSQAVKRAVESFDVIRVRAEVAECRQWSSGHIYFKLRDADHILEAVIWRHTASRLKTLPEDGLDVEVKGKLTTYSRQSRYQLVVESLELAGEGAFLKQLEDRRQRLLAEGLFDAARKKPIPTMPRIIGVITSPKGAVIRDILHRLRDRFPLHVLVWPVFVQGDHAAKEITAAIQGFDKLESRGKIPRPDVVIIARGGGSLEDLMAFNDEGVVRAIADSQLPIISAVGHETDTSLSDYAADLRAPTPTAAAELAVPHRHELHQRIGERALRLDNKIVQMLEQKNDKITALMRILGEPEQTLALRQQRLDTSLEKYIRIMERHFNALEATIGALGGRLRTPKSQIDERQYKLANAEGRLENQSAQILDKLAARLAQSARLLEASSYQNMLAKGFALVSNAQDGRLIKSVGEAPPHSDIRLRFADGSADATITASKAKDYICQRLWSHSHCSGQSRTQLSKIALMAVAMAIIGSLLGLALTMLA